MPPRDPTSKTPDLFDFAAEKPPATFERAAEQHASILPTDLSTSLAALPDQELERLLTAVTQEANQRGKEVKSETPTRQSNAQPRPLMERTRTHSTTKITAGQANLVRAAFRAGVKPRSIARKFGLTYDAVRKILG
jgi:hypothetical protein